MFKKIGCFLLCGLLLISQIATFASVQNVVETTEWLKGQDLIVTEGTKNEIVEKVEVELKAAMLKATTDMDAKNTIKNIHALLSEAVVRLDALRAMNSMEAYTDVLLAYMKNDRLVPSDVQWATDEFVALMEKKVSNIEGVNRAKTKYFIKKLIEENALIQGEFPIMFNQRLTVATLEDKLLYIEKSYRVTSNQLASVAAYKDLERGLSKKLVLKTDTFGVDVTLRADVGKQMVAEQFALTINEAGILYEVPLEFMQKHIGDFKVTITNPAPESLISYGNTVNDGWVKVLMAKNIRIGYGTNLVPIMIRVPVSDLHDETMVEINPSLLIEKNGIWNKSISDRTDNVLSTEIQGTDIVGVTHYVPTYADLTGHWSERMTATLLAQGIADQIDTEIFGPSMTITRGELARMLINVVGTEGKSENTYTDVTVNGPYADIIESIIYYGFTVGVSGDTFEADTLVTREDLAVFVATMYEAKYGYGLDPVFASFKDSSQISAYALESVMAMKAAGYISGFDDNTFRPKNTVTKAEAVALIYKVLMHYQR